MTRRRLSVVFLALAVLISACTGADEAPVGEETVEDRRDGSSAGLRDALTAAGVQIVDSPNADQVNGFQLLSFQVENMEREIDVGAGIVGFDLDELAGAPSGMPFSYLVAGWITGAGTPAAAAAGEIMGDQDWEVAPSLVYPTSVLTLFVADSLLAAGVTGETVGPQLIKVSAHEGLCTRASNWVNKALNWIFDGLRIDVAGDEWYAWAANIWNTAVDLAEKAVRKAIDVVTDVLLAPIQKALAVIGTVSMVVSSLKRWDGRIIPPDEAPELAVGGEPDTLATATLLVNTNLPEWDRDVADCAKNAGSPLPDPASAEGSEVSWEIGDDAYPKNLASIVEAGTDKTVNSDNTADVMFNPGRDEGGEPFLGWIHLSAEVEKNTVAELRETLWNLLTGQVNKEFDGDYEAVGEIIWTITEPIFDKLVSLLAVSYGPQLITVIHHSDVEFEYTFDESEVVAILHPGTLCEVPNADPLQLEVDGIIGDGIPDAIPYAVRVGSVTPQEAQGGVFKLYAESKARLQAYLEADASRQIPSLIGEIPLTDGQETGEDAWTFQGTVQLDEDVSSELEDFVVIAWVDLADGTRSMDMEFFELVTDLEDQLEGCRDQLIRIDIGRATDTIKALIVAGRYEQESFVGHPEFTIWVAPSSPDCQLRTGVAFGSNPSDCSFTVERGPDFLVDKELTLDEINGNLFYAWHGVDDLDQMAKFIGVDDPRCFDQSWYFRIFETGVMLGYPKGLVSDDVIPEDAPNCVTLYRSSTTEYETNP